MTSINMEFGFNVPKSVIYEALTHPMYFLIYSGKSCSTPDRRPKSNPKKEDNSSFWMEGFRADF